MRTGKSNPTVRENATVQDALLVMTQSDAAGATSIVDKHGKLKGYFTDGDLRRALQKGADILKCNITQLMTKNPRFLTEDAPAVEAAKMIHSTGVDNLPVLNKNGKVVGIVDEKDLIEYIALVEKK